MKPWEEAVACLQKVEEAPREVVLHFEGFRVRVPRSSLSRSNRTDLSVGRVIQILRTDIPGKEYRIRRAHG